MILRSAFAGSAVALGVLTAGLVGSSAQAQPYPPYGAYPPPYAQPYPPYRPVPGAAIPDDDDDDIPPHQRAAPGNYPPPPGGYRGPYASEPRQLPPPAYARPPAVVYGAPSDGYAPAPQPYGGRRPIGNGQPESYGAAPQAPQPYQSYPPQPQPQYGAAPNQAEPQGPMQLGPGQDARPPRDVTGTVRPNTVAALPADDQPETGKFELPPQFKRQLVSFQSAEPAGTLVIDTANTHLYLVLGNGQAMRYGIGVGREGFTWAGAERVSKMSEWPDWHPPAEMIERQPYLPRFMAGGEGNPLGARALYLGKTLYRIHGTNQPSTIGKYVSSGCIRLTNEDIQDLYSRVQVGTRVVVLPGSPPAQASNAPPPQQQPVQQR
jgi:lipoprotein-anchoring transpeptidase ErfK/SrfK